MSNMSNLDNLTLNLSLFMSILCCQNAYKIIQNLQKKMLNMGLTPPPPFSTMLKKLRYWLGEASLTGI